jgi:hypothetical protein
MPGPIASLTAKQVALLPSFVESWRKTALATSRVDPVAARRAVRELYRATGLREPRAVIFLNSPIAGLIARAILVSLVQHMHRAFPSFYVSFYDRNLHKHLCEDLDEPFSIEIWDATWAQLQEQIGEAQWRPLVAQLSNVDGTAAPIQQRIHGVVGDHLSVQLTPQLLEQLARETLFALRPDAGSPVREPIDAQIRNDFRRNIDRRDEHRPGAFLRRAYLRREWLEGYQQSCLIGGQEASSLALYDFAEHIGVKYDAKSKRQLEAYKDYAGSCGWLYAFSLAAFVSDRPTEIHFDAQRRLHNATGPAIRYCDGWDAYAWRGTGVTGWLIEQRNTITPQVIAELPYVNLRRAALEIYGLDRYVAACEPKVVATDELHGQPRRLLEVSVAGSPFRVIEVINGSREHDGTRRTFHLAAMPGDTPAEVIAASYGIASAIIVKRCGLDVCLGKESEVVVLTRRNFTGFACSALYMLTGLGTAETPALGTAGVIPSDPLIAARAEYAAVRNKFMESQNLYLSLATAAEKCAQARGLYPGPHNSCDSCRSALEAALLQNVKAAELEIATEGMWLALQQGAGH